MWGWVQIEGLVWKASFSESVMSIGFLDMESGVFLDMESGVFLDMESMEVLDTSSGLWLWPAFRPGFG